jgi:hypothetical protein
MGRGWAARPAAARQLCNPSGAGLTRELVEIRERYIRLFLRRQKIDLSNRKSCRPGTANSVVV